MEIDEEREQYKDKNFVTKSSSIKFSAVCLTPEMTFFAIDSKNMENQV